MSLRPRNAKDAGVPAFGSMYSTAIDFKTKHGPPEPVGVQMINDALPDATFVVEMYYGLIKDDIVQLDVPAQAGGRYLRFKISLLKLRHGRRKFADHIANNITSFIQAYGFTSERIDSDAYVCGSAANSFYALAFVQSDASPEYDRGFKALAMAIAGAEVDEKFVIDEDGFVYAYKFDDVSQTMANMSIRRAGPAPP